MAMIAVSTTLNETPVSAEAEPYKLLVHYRCNDLGVIGTHAGCETSQCGACVIHVGGRSKILHHVDHAGGRRGDHHD